MTFHALISLVESSGDWWQTHLVVSVFWTWTCMTECTWMGVISPSSLTHSPSFSATVIGYQSFVVETIVVAIKEARWKEVSILTFVHLSRPLSLCLPHSLWFHISPFVWTMNRATCSQKPVFRPCYQLDSRNHMAASNTRDENTRCKCFIPVQTSSRVFPSTTLDSECETPVSQFGIASYAEINQSPIFHPMVQTVKMFLLWASFDPVKWTKRCFSLEFALQVSSVFMSVSDASTYF